MKRFLKRAVLVVLVLIVIGLVVLYLSINGLIRSGVQTVATGAVGEPTTLDSANLALFSKNLTLSGLTIANPKDFSAPQFLTLGSVSVSVQPSSLMGDTVVVEDIVIDNLHVTIEQNSLKNNLKQILDQVQKQTAATAAAPESGSTSSGGKKLKIGSIKLTNTQVTIKTSGIPGVKDTEGTAKVKEMSITDPTNPDGRPMKIADLIGKVLVQVVQAASEDTGGTFGDALKSTTGFLQGSDLSKQFGQGAKSLGGVLDKGLGGAAKGLEGLFNKKPTTAPH